MPGRVGSWIRRRGAVRAPIVDDLHHTAGTGRTTALLERPLLASAEEPGVDRGGESCPEATPPPRWTRRTFRDPELEARYRRDGYLHLPLLDPAAIPALRGRFDDLYLGETENWCHRSNESSDVGYRRALHELISGAMAPAALELLDDHQVFSTGALVKWRGPDSLMPAHQDWTVVDESRYRTLSLWLPLCDVDEENGALAVLPESHRVLSPMRMSPDKPSWYVDPVNRIDPHSLLSVPMRAGECLIFDHGLLHFSPPNRTEVPRSAIVLAVAPTEADLVHHWRREDDVVERHAVLDREFFRRYIPGAEPVGDDVRLLTTVEYAPHQPWIEQWLSERVRLRPA